MDDLNMFLDWTARIAWPLTVIVIALLYRKPIYTLLHNLGEVVNRATKQPFKLSAGEYKLEFKKAVEEKKPKDAEEAISVAADIASKYIPYGVTVPGQKGLVTSPFAPTAGYVDVEDMESGAVVKDPYTGKFMRVP